MRLWRGGSALKTLRAAAALAAALLSLTSPNARAADSPAQALFASGDFDAAAVAFANVLANAPNDVAAGVGLGTVRLYENRLAASQTLLKTALAADPGNARAGRLLAEVQRRIDEAAKRVTIAGGEATVAFVTTDPLPVIRVRLNGNRDAAFLIDTGAPDVVVSDTLAKSLGMQTRAAGMGTFAGGRHAAVMKTTLASIALGGATAFDVTAAVLPVPQIDPSVQLDGIVGTGLLERFLATLDYPNARLILRARSAESSAAFEAAAQRARATIVPCWLVGDHYVFGKAQVNAAPPGLFLFDSGLAGGGVMPSAALVTSARLVLDQAHAFAGMGGGGAVTAVPFVASSVAVENAVQHDVPGLYTPEGSPLAMFSFTVQGIVSHDFLKHYAYTVDFDAMKIVLAPAGS